MTTATHQPDSGSAEGKSFFGDETITKPQYTADRADKIQDPLFWFILIAPLLTFVVRKMGVKFAVAVLIAQLATYIVYETGVSSQWNIRFDIFLFAKDSHS